MTIKELKEIIANLPDDMEVVHSDHEGGTTEFEIYVSVENNLYITDK